MLYQLRYREKFGVVQDLIDAADLAQAEQIGRLYCERTPSSRFISVKPAIVADASILPSSEAQDALPAKKSVRVGV